jgi:uracil phosphoribosyltransferase
MLDLVPTARIAHIGLYREPETFTAVEYFFKAPSDLHERLVIVISPVLATANSAVAAVDRLKERGANDIRLVCLIGAPEGVERMPRHSPGCSNLARGDRPGAGTATPISCRVSATPATAPYGTK